MGVTRRKLSKTMIDYIEIEIWAAEYAKQYSGTSDIELAAIRAAAWANDVNGKKMAEMHVTIARLIVENDRLCSALKRLISAQNAAQRKKDYSGAIAEARDALDFASKYPPLQVDTKPA